MEAANPLVRWILLAGLMALSGCQSDGSSSAVNARGQSPPDPVPPAPRFPVGPASPPGPASPAGPLAPVAPAAPVDPNGPVQGYPVTAATAENTAPVPGFPVNSEPIARTSLVTPAPVPPTPPLYPSPALASHKPVRVVPAEIKNSTPQVKMVAQVGTSNFITDQEVIEAARVKIQNSDFRTLEGPLRVAKEKEYYQDMLRELIERELLIDDFYVRMKKGGKSNVDDIKEMASQQADQTILQIRKQFGVRTEEEFIMRLRADGLTLPVFRRQIERQMMAEEYLHGVMKELGKNPGFTDIRAYYDNHPEQFKVEDRVRWQDLFVSFNNHPSRQAAYEHAEQVLRQAQGGADFVALIKQQEKGPAGRQNWDGIGTTRESVPLDLAPTVWALQPGQISGLIELPGGFHIVKVLERQYAGLRPFDTKVQTECQERLKREYREADRKKLIQELWRRTAIQVFERLD